MPRPDSAALDDECDEAAETERQARRIRELWRMHKMSMQLLTLVKCSTGTIASPGAEKVETRMIATLTRFLRAEHGATAIEYGLIAAGIAIVIIPALQLVGTHLKTTFSTVATNI
jgi:pilus assembly protein Flp/PilA